MKIGGIYITLILVGIALPVYAAEVSLQQVESVEQQAQARQMEHKRLQAQAIQLSLELAKMNKQMIAAAKRLQSDEEKTTKTEEELQLLENRLKVAEEEFNREYGNLSATLSSLQNLALHPTEAVLFQPLTPVETIRSAMLLRESVPFLKENAAKIKIDLEDITKQKKEVEEKLQKLSEQKKSLQSQQQKLKKMSEQKSAVRKQIEGESVKTQKEAQKLASEASDLRELMEKLEHEKEIRERREKEIRRAAKKRAEEERCKLEEEQKRRIAAGESVGLATESGESFELSEDADWQEEAQDIELVKLKPTRTQERASDFAKARGSLTRPARGDIITAYGQELSKGVNSKGIVIQTRGSAQVIAPYDGSIIFSGPFKGYGNLIIIDHGRGYVSLLAGMNSVDTEIGQMVLAGEPVGIMPDGEMARLYMEIRKDQRPVNPAPWLGS